jgi:hypothetical protein
VHTVHEKKPTKELVGRERKTVQEKSKKYHPEAARGLGDVLSAREGDLIIVRDEAVSLGLVQIIMLEIRRQPAGRGVRSVALAHLVLLRISLDAHQWLPDEGTWVETWRKERKRQPTNGQGHCKITAWPMSNDQSQVKITYRVIILMTS